MSTASTHGCSGPAWDDLPSYTAKCVCMCDAPPPAPQCYDTNNGALDAQYMGCTVVSYGEGGRREEPRPLASCGVPPPGAADVPPDEAAARDALLEQNAHDDDDFTASPPPLTLSPSP